MIKGWKIIEELAYLTRVIKYNTVSNEKLKIQVE
jgi:hypothetical protein